MICREIEITYKRAKKTSELKMITNSEEIYNAYREFMSDDIINLRECFYVAHLNRGGKLLGMQKVSEGGTAATSVDIKLILSTALKALSHSLILIHNHPSGTLQSSMEDDKITKRIAEAARLFDIRVNDHLIITDSGYYSYCEHGRI